MDVDALGRYERGSVQQADQHDRIRFCSANNGLPPSYALARREIDPMTGAALQLRIRSKRPNGRGNMLLALATPDLAIVPGVSPGAYIDILTPMGAIRHFLCNGPWEQTAYEICVRLDTSSRGGAAYLHNLAVGQAVEVLPASGGFAAAAGPHVLLAEGIGVSPLVAMARTLSQAGSGFRLHAFVKDAEDQAFAEELTIGYFAHRCRLHVSAEPVSATECMEEAIRDIIPDTTVIICGSRSFVGHARAAITAIGLPPRLVHDEIIAEAARDSQVWRELAKSA